METVYRSGPVSSAVSEERTRRADFNTPVFTGDPKSWENKSVVSVAQFSGPALELLFRVADSVKAQLEDKSKVAKLILEPPLRGRVLGTLFYENSTRTACSFQAAMLRLGGTYLSVSAGSSSIKKGETLEDTVCSLLSYCDAIALRHPKRGAARAAAGVARRPVLNAGDGVGEHPTQALLDLYTILREVPGARELSDLKGKVIAMVGDLKHGRTVHSLAVLLARFGCRFRYVSPESLRMPQDVQGKVAEVNTGASKVEQTEHEALDDVLGHADVLYVTRIQKERFSSEQEYEAVKGCYRITRENWGKAKASAVLMHPLPRVDEIAEDCDSDPRAAYFRQMENGMFVRMALLLLLLGRA